MEQHYALVDNGIVIQVLRVDPATIYPTAHAQRFELAPYGVQEGWVRDGFTFKAPKEQE